MLYSEVVEKIRNNEKLMGSEISGKQLMMLLQDKEIKNISFKGKLYEVNFVPVTFAFEADDIDDVSCPNIGSLTKFFDKWVDNYEREQHNYIQMDGEYFELILDILETNE